MTHLSGMKANTTDSSDSRPLISVGMGVKYRSGGSVMFVRAVDSATSMVTVESHGRSISVHSADLVKA